MTVNTTATASSSSTSDYKVMKETDGRELSAAEIQELQDLFAVHPRVKASAVASSSSSSSASSSSSTIAAASQQQQQQQQHQPHHNTKTVHFVRHAEALHNQAFKLRGRAAYSDPCFLDPELTELGINQSLALKPSVMEIQDSLELVVVSPLRRTLQTAALAFEQPMTSTTTTTTTTTRANAPWVAHEVVRERIGKNTCDKRRHLAEIKAEYAAIDFDHIESEEDTLWTPHHRERPAEMAKRGIEFCKWLAQRPEKNIAVVTHSAFLLTLFTQVLDCPPELQKWFENGELRSVHLHL